MRFEPLHYDAESRVIYDENRLAVARDVAPDLAAVLCAAPTYAAAADAHHAFEMTPQDRGGAYGPKGKAKTEWLRLLNMASVIKAENEEPAPRPADPPLWAILADMLAYEAEQFDGDEDSPLDISGADLVDAFTTWRGQLRAALAAPRSPRPAALDRIAARLRGEWYNPAGDLESDIADVLREAGAYD